MKSTKDEEIVDGGEMVRLENYPNIVRDSKSNVSVARKIDAKKLKTLEDVILIIAALHLFIDPKSGDFKTLEHLLEDEQ